MKNYEKIFLILGLIIGTLFVFIIPPFQGPDEDAHFKKAYVLGKLDVFTKTDGNITGYYLPDDMVEYIDTKYDRNHLEDRQDFKYSFKEMYLETYTPADYSKKSLYPVLGSRPYVHAIPAIGVMFGNICAKFVVRSHPSSVFLLYFARMACLISYLILGYILIKVLPKYKKSALAILLNPLSLFMGSIVNYDSYIIPCSLLVVALMLRIKYDDKCKFEFKHVIIFSILGYIMLTTKVVYFPSLLTLFLIPKDKFKFKNNKKNNKFFAASMVIGLILAMYILSKLFSLFNQVGVGSGVSLMSQQLSYIKGHPFIYVGILIKNVLSSYKIQIMRMIGTLGLLDTRMPALAVIFSLFNMIYIFVVDACTSNLDIKWKDRLVYIVCILLAVVGIYTSQYLMWTPIKYGIGGNYIDGVQGRYFIPLLLFAPLLITNKWIKNKKVLNLFEESFDINLCIIFINLLVALFTCLVRYWI